MTEEEVANQIADRLQERGRKASTGEPLFFDRLNLVTIILAALTAARASQADPDQATWADLGKLLKSGGMDDPAFLSGIVQSEIEISDQRAAEITSLQAENSILKSDARVAVPSLQIEILNARVRELKAALVNQRDLYALLVEERDQAEAECVSLREQQANPDKLRDLVHRCAVSTRAIVADSQRGPFSDNTPGSCFGHNPSWVKVTDVEDLLLALRAPSAPPPQEELKAMIEKWRYAGMWRDAGPQMSSEDCARELESYLARSK